MMTTQRYRRERRQEWLAVVLVAANAIVGVLCIVVAVMGR